MLRALRVAFACALISLAVAGTARAGGGNYVFNGGTAAQQAEVKAALDASSFPWSVVPRQVVIHIGSGYPTQATPGHVWLNANLVDSGVFSHGLIQHEYAHQVDFLMLSSAARRALTSVLGGKQWCWGDGVQQLEHDEYGCERFASTLAWSFWQSPDNELAPENLGDESAALPPARFKALLGALLKAPGEEGQLVSIQAFIGNAPPLARTPAPAAAAKQAAPPAPVTAPAPVAAATPAPAPRLVRSTEAARKRQQPLRVAAA